MKTTRIAAALSFVLTVLGGGHLTGAQLLVDSDFNASSDSAALRANSTGQDWYESRQDEPSLLTLDRTTVGGNNSAKAKLTATTNNKSAYLTQEFSSPQTQAMSAQWRIYVDSIAIHPSNPDRAAWMLIGDDTGTDPSRIGPNAEDGERFVYMAFYKDGGGTTGTMSLVARDRDDTATAFTTVATGLNLKQWYTIKVNLDLAKDTYDVYVDGQYKATVTARTAKNSVTHISFAEWGDGPGTFYVDDVTAESSSSPPSQAGEVVVVDQSWQNIGLIGCKNPIADLGQWSQCWTVGQPQQYIAAAAEAPAGARVTGVTYWVELEEQGVDVYPAAATFWCSDYEIGISSAAGGTGNFVLVWDNAGGQTDQGLDDDAANDRNINLVSRTTHAFDGQLVNQQWCFRIKDTVSHSGQYKGVGCFTYVKIVIQYGESVSCPSAAAVAATGIGCNSATLNGRITNDGGEACQYKFRCTEEGGGSYTETSWTGSKRTGESFGQTMSDLKSGVKYNFAAKAKNSRCESAWSSELSFTTGLLQVETQAATAVTCSSATLNGRVVDGGGAACQYKFRYKKEGSTTYTETAWTGSRTTGQTFNQAITGLSPTSTYYFAAKITNSACESPWGTEMSFTTVSSQAETQAATAVKCNSATLNGRVAADGGEACQYRFRYKKQGSSTYTETAWTGAKRTGESFNQMLMGLTLGTKYYFAAQVRDSTCESLWSVELTFTTLKPPTVTSQAATRIMARGATLNGRIVDDGGGTCQYQFRYKPAGGSYTETPWAGSVRGANAAFSTVISGLIPSTTYLFAVRAKNDGCEEGVWSNELSFKTLTIAKPTAAILDATNVLDRSATFAGKIIDDGNEPCQYRFRYTWAPLRTRGTPLPRSKPSFSGVSGLKAMGDTPITIPELHPMEVATYTNTSWTGAKQDGESFREDITTLNPNTQYGVTVQARNAAGEGPWSTGVSFTTLAIPEITDVHGTYFTGTLHDYFLHGVPLTEQITVEVKWNGAKPGKIEWKTPTRTYETLIGPDTRATEVSRTFNMGADFGVGGQLMVKAVPSPDAQGARESAWVTANFTVIPPPPGIPKDKLSPLPPDRGCVVYVGEFTASLLDESVPAGTISDDIDYLSENELGISSRFPIQVAVMDGTALYQPIGLPFIDVHAAGGLLKGFATFSLFCSYRNGQWQTEGSLHIFVNNSFRTPGVWIYIPPIFALTFHIVIGLDVNAILNIVGWPQGQNPDLAGLLCIEPFGEGEGVVGLGEFLGVGGWLRVGVRACFDYQKPSHLAELCANLAGGPRECFLWFCFEQDLFDIWWPEECGKANRMAAAFSAGPVACKAHNGEFKLMNRDYLGPDYARWLPPGPADNGQGRNLTILSATDGAPGESGEEQVLQTKIFGMSKPSIAADGDQLFLAWAYDDPNRSGVNRTKVVFSRSEGGTWTGPEAIHDNGAVDFSPQLAVLPNGQVLCTWEKLNRILPDTVDPTGAASAMEIAVASYDNATGLWNTKVLTADSHMDRTPRIATGDNNKALVVWVHNDRDDIRSEDPSALNTIRYSQWNGSTWSSPATAAAGIGCMLKTTLAYNGTQGVYVYSVDGDWDMGTTTDHELYALVYDGTRWLPPRRLTHDDILDANPQVVYDANSPLLVWYRHGQVVSCRNLDPNDYRLALEAGEFAGTMDFRIAKAPGGRISLVWTDASTASKGTDVFAAMYDPSFDLWSNAFALTSDADVEKALAVTFAGPDELALIYNKDRLRASPTGPQELYQTDLCVLRHRFGRDLAISPEDISIGKPDSKNGGRVQITAVVHNLGDAPEVDVPVRFYYGKPGEDGELIGDPQIIRGPIPAAGQATVSITWTIPQADSVTQLCVVVFDKADPQTGQPERDTNNNVACIPVMVPDLTVKSISVEKTDYKMRKVVARIANLEPVSARDVDVTIRRDSPEGEELTHLAIAKIGGNSAEEVSWDWDIASLTFDHPEIVLYVIVDATHTVTEADENNNMGLALVQVSKTGDITDDGSVDETDLFYLMGHWLDTSESSDWLPGCDLDHNGRIDAADFAILGKNWHWQAAWHTE